MSRIALITGTSTGIGLSTAIHLAKSGFKVIATMRSVAKAGPLQERAKAEGVTLEVKALDVESDGSVQACIREVVAAHGQIDLLVNNAGAGHLGSLEQSPMDEVRKTMEVNFFGVWRVTQAVFPAMRERRSGRIITLSSIGGLVGQPFNDAYCAAKFACEGFLESLAPVAKRLGVQIVLVEPGPVSTEFVANVRTRLNDKPPAVIPEYQAMLDSYLAGSTEVFSKMAQTGDDVAKVIVEAATAETPHFRYTTSELIKGMVARKYTDPTGDSILAMTGARLP